MRAGTFLVAAILGVITTLVMSGAADAATVSVICGSSPTALADAISSNPPGTVFQITGLCQETVEVATSLSLVNHLGSEALISGDGVQGELVITGSSTVVIDGIMLEGTLIDTGLPDVLEVNGAAAVTIKNAQIMKGQRTGLNVTGATVKITSTPITRNGLQNITGQKDGVTASGATLLFQGLDISDNVGNGITLLKHSQASILGSSISNNQGGQVFAAGGSNLQLSATSVFQPEPIVSVPFTLQAIEGSTVWLLPNTIIEGGDDTLGTGTGGILIASSSSLFTIGTQIFSLTARLPAIEVSGNSNAVIGGGNAIENTSFGLPLGGIALQIDHGSSFQQIPLAGYAPELLHATPNFTPAPDFINGSALVQEQSQIELGMGTVINLSFPVLGNATLRWGVPAGNCILVQQNSSIRLSGGVTFAGTPPSPCALNGGAVSSTITIQQDSNGFFNLSQGGTIQFDNSAGGGNVSCVFAGMPNAHVTGKANISPPSAQPVVIGGLADALNATSPGCLGP